MLRAGQEVREYHLDAELLHEFRQHGSQYPAYGSIVAAGANACVLHYRADTAPVRDGELVLIDAGCELDGYASDITRTFPANGRFTGPQRALYDLVLASQEAAMAATKPGARFTDPHEATVQACWPRACWTWACSTKTRWHAGRRDRQRAYFAVLHAPHRPLAGHGRARLRQLRRARRGGPGQRTQRPAERRNHHRPPQPHPAPRHGADHRARPVRAPGDRMPEQFWNIGIRIEDDAIVTETGCELITRGVPVKADEIEALMRAAGEKGGSPTRRRRHLPGSSGEQPVAGRARRVPARACEQHDAVGRTHARDHAGRAP
jgi:Xaa-Pro aminopeptidase